MGWASEEASDTHGLAFGIQEISRVYEPYWTHVTPESTGRASRYVRKARLHSPLSSNRCKNNAKARLRRWTVSMCTSCSRVLGWSICMQIGLAPLSHACKTIGRPSKAISVPLGVMMVCREWPQHAAMMLVFKSFKIIGWRVPGHSIFL